MVVVGQGGFLLGVELQGEQRHIVVAPGGKGGHDRVAWASVWTLGHGELTPISVATSAGDAIALGNMPIDGDHPVAQMARRNEALFIRDPDDEAHRLPLLAAAFPDASIAAVPITFHPPRAASGAWRSWRVLRPIRAGARSTSQRYADPAPGNSLDERLRECPRHLLDGVRRCQACRHGLGSKLPCRETFSLEPSRSLRLEELNAFHRGGEPVGHQFEEAALPPGARRRAAYASTRTPSSRGAGRAWLDRAGHPTSMALLPAGRSGEWRAPLVSAIVPPG